MKKNDQKNRPRDPTFIKRAGTWGVYSEWTEED